MSYVDLVLVLMYAVLAAALAVTAYSVWHGMRTRRKGDDIANRVPAGRIGWCVLVALVGCLFVTFLLGSSEPVITNGQPFTSVFWLKVTDMFIYTSVILVIGCFVSAFVSRFRS
jgi:hypothetical protein